MATIADGMIADGVTVLAIVNLDSDSGASIQEKAATQGVKTIDYDRLTLGGSADVYVSFDNTKVGELQGQGLVDCLGGKQANIVFLNGSPTDNNATLFCAGAHSVLDATTNYTIVGEQAVPDWDNDKAVTIFEQLYTAADGKVDGVYAANDGLGRLGHLDPGEEQAGRPGSGHRPGRHRRGSAERPRRHPVHDGLQVRQAEEAGALADAAIALAKGEEPRPPAPSRTTRAAGTCRRCCSTRVDHQGQRQRRHRRRRPVKDDVCAGDSSPRPCAPQRGTSERPIDPLTSRCLHGHERPILELRGVNKSFGVVHVLHDVDFARLPRPGDRPGR